MEERFNGDVFVLSEDDAKSLESSQRLALFAHLVEGRQEPSGQRLLWRLYSFADLPVELISHIYQLFVEDTASSVYTPPFLVRMILGELLDEDRLDRLHEQDEIILDPACGSGVFLVEAFKRLVLHWRYRNNWKSPTATDLKRLLRRVHGIDLEPGAVELSAFSLCVAMCDALKTNAVARVRFEKLAGTTLHQSCFFEAKQNGLIPKKVGVVVGNPPFKSQLTTPGEQRSYTDFTQENGFVIPDKQLAYLFLYDALRLLSEGGVIGMLQQYNFLYNETSTPFRRHVFERWNVRQLSDLVSVDGLFRGGGKSTKVVVVFAEASIPDHDSPVLHATFRRTARVGAEQGFDIDYYDLHWVPRRLAIDAAGVWRANLLGGSRVLSLLDRLKEFRTLEQYALQRGCRIGEGFVEGDRSKPGPHIAGHRLIEPEHLGEGTSLRDLRRVKDTHFERPRTRARFTCPMLLIHEQEDLTSRVLRNGYYTYKNKIFGVNGSKDHSEELLRLGEWIRAHRRVLQAFVTAAGQTTLTQRSSWVRAGIIKSLPYPSDEELGISPNEQIIVDDIVDYYRDFVRKGQDAPVMRACNDAALEAFNAVVERQINAIYGSNPLKALRAEQWEGFRCQPFVFGNGNVDWSGSESLKDRLRDLIHEKHGTELYVNRVIRIYDGQFLFLLKPNLLRYWLRSIALQDADEIITDLRGQGF